MSKVSFGALAKAQDALSKTQSTDQKRKRGEDSSKSQEDKLEALRERLRQIKAEKLANGDAKPNKKSKVAEKSEKTKAKHSKRNESEGEEGDSDSDAAPHARSSKHAPAVQSSKRMVSRKRTVVDVKKPVFRDPRFENVGGPRPDEETVSRRYAFLNDYKASEIADLKKAIKKSRNGDEKEQMRKQLESMESQQKTQQRKDEQQAVVREHKKKEKELVKDGKQPFYLKKCMLPAILIESFTDVSCSRAKEACLDRPLPEHEVEAARPNHRAPSQEGYCKGTEEHARGATRCMSSQVPAAWTGSGREQQGCQPTLMLTSSHIYPFQPHGCWKMRKYRPFLLEVAQHSSAHLTSHRSYHSRCGHHSPAPQVFARFCKLTPLNRQ
jgi:ribosomal RNA-processing protein 36